MPDINRGTLITRVSGSERIRTRHVDRTWQAAPTLTRNGGGRMLLSFERPATRRPSPSTARRAGLGVGPRPAPQRRVGGGGGGAGGAPRRPPPPGRLRSTLRGP